MRRLFIFDFDDTLIDNFKVDYESFRKPLEEAGYEMISEQELRHLREKGFLAENIISSLSIPKKSEILNARKILLYEYCLLSLAEVKEGALELCKTLRQKGNIVAIATFRKNRGAIKKFLQEKEISKYVDIILCNDVFSGDTDPQELKNYFYEQLMKKYGLKASEVVVIGDKLSDLLPARKLGMKTIGVDGTYTKKESLSEVSDHLCDFKKMLVLVEGSRL